MGSHRVFPPSTCYPHDLAVTTIILSRAAPRVQLYALYLLRAPGDTQLDMHLIVFVFVLSIPFSLRRNYYFPFLVTFISLLGGA